MGTAIYKLYENKEFKIGAFVSDNGDMGFASTTRTILNNLKTYQLEPDQVLYHTIKKLEAETHLTRICLNWDRRKPFDYQMPEYPTLTSLFWIKDLTPKRLMKEMVVGQYEYIIRIMDTHTSVKITYEGRTKTFTTRTSANWAEPLEELIQDLHAWVLEVDKELADCDCFDKEN